MAGDPRDYKVELSGRADDAPPSDSASRSQPFLSVHFACCGVYQRIYRAADGSHYSGRCPKCGKAVRFDVGQGGTDCRFFKVS
jgi:hypothetical protein